MNYRKKKYDFSFWKPLGVVVLMLKILLLNIKIEVQKGRNVSLKDILNT